MEWVTISAKTVALAVERALDMLGVHQTELEYEVIAEPKAKMLGLMRTEATIRARVKPISREKPNDRRRRKSRDDRKPRSEGGAQKKSQPQGQKEAGKSQPAKSRPAAETSDEATESTAERAPSSRSRSRNRKRPAGGAATTAPEATSAGTSGEGTAPVTSDAAPEVPDAGPTRPQPKREAPAMASTGTVEEQVTAARAFAEGLVEAFGVEATVTADTVDHDVIEVSITGEELGLLLGPQGVTLAALEELLRGSVGHRGPARLHLDVAGYRARRRAALADFARKVAAEVVASGAVKALEPMGAPDRKVVHDTIAEIDGVTTTSDGEEPRRRVVIKPA